MVVWQPKASGRRGVPPPQGVAFYCVFLGDVREGLAAGEGGLDGLCCPAVKGACVGPNSCRGGCLGVGSGYGGGLLQGVVCEGGVLQPLVQGRAYLHICS